MDDAKKGAALAASPSPQPNLVREIAALQEWSEQKYGQAFSISACHDLLSVVKEAALSVSPPIGDQEWCQPGDIRKRQFLVTFDDPECRNAVFDDEAEARRFWAKACLNWNCYLFGALAVDPSPQPKSTGDPALWQFRLRARPDLPWHEWQIGRAPIGSHFESEERALYLQGSCGGVFGAPAPQPRDPDL